VYTYENIYIHIHIQLLDVCGCELVGPQKNRNVRKIAPGTNSTRRTHFYDSNSPPAFRAGGEYT